jgi:hypothetical protein
MKKTIAALCLVLSITGTFAHAQQLEWIRQGTVGNVDFSRGVSADGSENVYISGVIFDDIVKSFVRKYDAAGNLLWDREILDDAELNLGLSDWTEGYGVSADGQGSVYSVGFTQGELAGTHLGGRDAFIGKYNEDGTREWIRQFGSSADDIAYNVSADQLGNVFMSGSLNGDSQNPSAALEDAFIRKYDAAGNLQWARQLGAANLSEVATGVSGDGLGNAYVVGSMFVDGSFPPLVASDVFLSKYNSAGFPLWTKQIGDANLDERATGVSADGLGNVFISLNTMGENIPMQLGSVQKYNELGSLLWTYVPEQGSIAGVSADGLGNVYISGSGEQLSPDTYVSKLDASGNLIWTVRFAQSGNDDYLMHVSYGISADGLGNVYSAGQVDDFSASINFDSFVAKISVPEPTCLALITLCMMAGVGLRKHRSR